MQKIFLLFVFHFLFFFSILSCDKSSKNNGISKSYTGPTQCNMRKRTPISGTIIGGVLANGKDIDTGSNTVAIVLHDKTLCTGTIVADNLILTAGHCFDGIDTNETSPGNVIFANNYNSTNSATISCWQRPSAYSPKSDDDSYNTVLNDIAWIKINGTVKSNYEIVSVLSNPQSILPSETKWMIGFGDLTNENDHNSSKNVVKSTSSDTTPDITPIGAIASFNRLTFPNAFQNYLTVIGPNAGKGTCKGDSGGPVYVKRFINGIETTVLAALTQGSNSLLSPHPRRTTPPYDFDNSQYASCSDGYGVYTTVGNYVNWIQTTSGVTLSLY